VVLEAGTAGCGASGRNGGFANASLTHGLENGAARFEDELPALEKLGAENFAELRADSTPTASTARSRRQAS
jgi:glycine/D-amino acid oxidase-like deaminating enzyme